MTRHARLALMAVGLAVAACADTGDTSAAPAASRALAFVTLPGDTIAIVDATPEAVRLATFAPVEGGFVRGLVPMLLQTRRIRRLDPDAPFTLLRTSDGILHLEDPTIGERIDLAAFGPDALAVFDPLLPMDGMNP